MLHNSSKIPDIFSDTSLIKQNKKYFSTVLDTYIKCIFGKPLRALIKDQEEAWQENLGKNLIQ